MSKAENQEMIELMAKYLSKSDIYAIQVNSKISAFVFNFRTQMHMNQSDFAKMMGVTQGMVSKWESATYNFTIEHIARISEKLGYTFDITFVSEIEYLKHYHPEEYSQEEFKQGDCSFDEEATRTQVEAIAFQAA